MTASLKLGARLRRRILWEGQRLSLWWNDTARMRWHDATQARRLRVQDGAVPLARRLAILAIYPNRGLQPSHLATLRHLQGRGYAPLVVSNLPLPEADAAQLRPLCWRLIQRPNYGFDIGGFRAALDWLGPRLDELDRLVLTNDSIWFPIGPARDWLSVADDLAKADPAGGPDLIGAVSNGGMARDERSGEWRLDRESPDFHYCSFALSFGPRVLRDPDFRRFWQQMRLTDDKHEIVRRGEIAISRWVIGRGYTHAACWDIEGLEARLAARPLDDLVPLIDALIIPEDPQLRSRRDAFRASDQVRDHEAVIRFLMTAIVETGPAYALPAWTLREDGFGFLKKSPLRLDPLGRQQTLAVLGDTPALLREAREIAGPPTADAATGRPLADRPDMI
ncbi:rhamnan synthesis F family protein [Paracoccus tibetensis]|uniref:Rhamnan synthesis protein F n=1 Tax=Paracoccus tibetensis TaxID=336292 RepID=A0A1G5BP97_9RHOB|nr:rhamnan synthesis F family protein [Paracoccus tibetensis]SCX92012.1 Rhamnan synthesis protein F [Paracoccus tibetensis]